MVTYTQAQRDGAGHWLCNVADKCSQLAVKQSAYDCSSCGHVAEQHAERIAELEAERVTHEQAFEILRQELARRANAGEDTRLSVVEEVAVRLGQDRVKDLGGQLEALKAAQAAVTDEHTHPVFACAKHADQLPALPASLTSVDQPA